MYALRPITAHKRYAHVVWHQGSLLASVTFSRERDILLFSWTMSVAAVVDGDGAAARSEW